MIQWYTIFGRENNGSKDVPVLISRTRNFKYLIKVKNLEMEKLSWIMQEGPISLHTSLNVENIPGVIRVRGDGGGKSDKCYFADLEEGEGTLSPLI